MARLLKYIHISIVDRGRYKMNSIKDKVYMIQYTVRECACVVLGVKYIHGRLLCQPIKRDTVR